MIAPLNRGDFPQILFLGVSFVYGLVFSWQRWGNPLVDCGREMQQPLRLVQGEMLYSDVRHIYGPLSPYLNSLLYAVFGISLDVLIAGGIVSAIVIITLCYWLARQLMGRWAALAAALSVMWLCAFKQAGNYFLPYSYNALHGCALGLLMLACLVKAVPQATSQKGQQDAGESVREDAAAGNQETSYGQAARRWLLLAGLAAALTFLAKTEIGVAALAAGIVAGVVLGYPRWQRASALVSLFLLPAVVVIVAVYGVILWRVGWQTFYNDSYLLFQNIPPELVYFNRRMSGLDRPLDSLLSIVGALFRLGVLLFAVVTVSLMLTRRREDRRKPAPLALPDAGRASFAQLALLLSISIIAVVSLSLAGVVKWDNGPYLAMPVLLVILLLPVLRQYLKQIAERGFSQRQTMLLIIMGVYALVSLFRVILRVRSGGAYSSYLLPASVILFTYIFCFQFTRIIKEPRARQLARNIGIGLILTDAVLTSFLLVYRYRVRNTYPIVTARGAMLAVPDIGQAFAEAFAFINRETAPGDYVAVMPEGTSLLFFTDRRNPLREEITTPGFVDAAAEERAIARLQQTSTKLIFVANRATSEFGPIRFGVDYNQRLMNWVKENYVESEVFGPSHDPNLKIGDPVFFLRAYRLKTE